PGPGLGGHCIPIDPFYLTWKAREFGLTTKFIELAGEINTSMPKYVVQKLHEALDQRFQKGLKGTRVLLVGLAYKKNVDDIRESPSFVLMEELKKRGALVEYYDPYVPEILPMREHQEFIGQKSIKFPEDLSQYEVALICTDHDQVDYELLTRSLPLVVDSRNATGRITDESLRAKIVLA
ncbi:MAG TPA: UDP binding domain-containing protein, partial [Alphaproteobacteria bacterium]|nr:UDP binding domain-containing protein [Alphaproteobacteria bacterium]